MEFSRKLCDTRLNEFLDAYRQTLAAEMVKQLCLTKVKRQFIITACLSEICIEVNSMCYIFPTEVHRYNLPRNIRLSLACFVENSNVSTAFQQSSSVTDTKTYDNDLHVYICTTQPVKKEDQRGIKN